MKRRELIKAVLGGAALVPLTGCNGDSRPLDSSGGGNTPPPTGDLRADVCVIGAGISGLTAARRCEQKGLSVVVLEANDRVGGRTVNLPLAGGGFIEGGGEWVGPSSQQSAVRALAAELGIETYLAYGQAAGEGNNLMLYRGSRSTFTGEIPLGDPAGLADLLQAQTRWEQMASEIPEGRAWDAPNAHLWDSMTIWEWMQTNMLTDGGKWLLSLIVLLTTAARPEDLSLLFYLEMIAGAGGSFTNLYAKANGAQERRISGGSQRISSRLAEELTGPLVLSSPVSGIDQSNPSSVSVASRRCRVTAKRVIVALHPQDAARLAYAPLLPIERQMLHKNWPTGCAYKLNVVYPTPFWRADGYSGMVISDVFPYFADDNSLPGDPRGLLVCFVGAQHELSSRGIVEDKASRHAAVLNGLATFFGPKALAPLEIVEGNWIEQPWIAGCESPLQPGMLTTFGKSVAARIDRIHWAGTETAGQWKAYMDGAVRAGERAANEVSMLMS